jgi:hypothetical protein
LLHRKVQRRTHHAAAITSVFILKSAEPTEGAPDDGERDGFDSGGRSLTVSKPRVLVAMVSELRIAQTRRDWRHFWALLPVYAIRPALGAEFASFTEQGRRIARFRSPRASRLQLGRA